MVAGAMLQQCACTWHGLASYPSLTCNSIRYCAFRPVLLVIYILAMYNMLYIGVYVPCHFPHCLEVNKLVLLTSSYIVHLYLFNTTGASYGTHAICSLLLVSLHSSHCSNPQ